jgi:hypothetical protein
VDKPEPIRRLKTKGSNGEAPPPKPRVILPPDAPLAELVVHKPEPKPKLRALLKDAPIPVPDPELFAGSKQPPSVVDWSLTGTTREEWLQMAAQNIREHVPTLADCPPVRLSIGFPGGRGKKKGVIGQCFGAGSAEGVPAIFISPVLKEPVGSDRMGVLPTLIHEMVHAAGHMHHRGPFAKAAAKAGLVGPWTATKASEELAGWLQELADEMPPFDHGRVNSGAPGGRGPVVQTTRMLKVLCDACGYTLRTTAKWLAVGVPDCPNADCDAGEMSLEDK